MVVLIALLFHFIFFICWQVINGPDDTSGTCVWYGVCKTTQALHKLYCSYNGTAQPLDNHGQELLQQYCPHLANGANKTFTCCDEEQVTKLGYFNTSKLSSTNLDIVFN